MANDIYTALAGDLGAYESYLADDPFYGAGAQIRRAQIQPTNNTEAFLMPILQGALGGGLSGYGASRAKDEMYDDYRQSALLKALAGVEDSTGVIPGIQNAYAAEERPEDWSPEKAKQGLVLAALAGQHEKAKEIKAQEFKDEIRKLIATETIKAGIKQEFEGGGTNPLLTGVPKNLQDQAAKELPIAAKKETIDNVVDKEFEKASGINSIAAMIPNSTAANEMAGLQENLMLQVQSLTGKEMSDVTKKGFRDLLPDWNDSEQKIAAKKVRFKELLKGIGEETPIMTAYKVTPTLAAVGGGAPKYKASDLIAQGYRKTDAGWVK